VRLSSHLSAGSAAAAAAAGVGVGSAAEQVKSGRPLHEVIAAANAQLAVRYRRQVASGLRELCEKLQAGAGGGNRGSSAAAAAGGTARADVTSVTAAAADVQGSGDDASRDQAAAAAEGENEDGDEYATLSLLRRLQLWPVTAELLRSTAAGKQVSSLAKNHPSQMVRSLASQVVAQWKALLAMQAAAAAKAAAQKQAEDEKAAGKGASSKGSKAAEGLIEEGLRSRVVVMIKDALAEHRGKVLQQQQQHQHQQRQQQQDGSAAAAAAKSSVPAEEIPQLQALAQQLEQELHTHIVSNNSSSNSSRTAGAAAAAAGRPGSGSSSSSSGSAVTDYKKQARMLCTGLRYPDGIAGQLLKGERAPREVSNACVG
jgi:hypothetical protein